MNKEKEVTNSFSGKGVFPVKWAFTLLFPLRNIFMSPKELISRLQLEHNMKVLEIGPGPGYFSVKIASFLTKGTITVADLQQGMLDYTKNRVEKEKLNNVSYYLCDGNSFEGLNDSYFDRIFMVTVIGEVENQNEYISEFYRILKPGGILSISEQAGDPDKMTISEVRSLAEKHGFEYKQLFGKEKNYTINFEKL